MVHDNDFAAASNNLPLLQKLFGFYIIVPSFVKSFLLIITFSITSSVNLLIVHLTKITTRIRMIATIATNNQIMRPGVSISPTMSFVTAAMNALSEGGS